MTSSTSSVPAIALNNGTAIPQLGFGVFQIEPSDTAEAVAAALKIGYRHIDTAEMYGNEAQVAEGIRQSGVDPADIWVTSKLNNNAHGYDKALAAFDETLRKLDIAAIDLMLIHWPLPTVGDSVATWQALEQVYREGRARSIGVSNFNPEHLERIAKECEVVPVVNQIEAHPYFPQNELLTYNSEHDIATEAWSPIAQGAVLNDPVINDIAASHRKTPSQVTLRWHIQRGSIVFPKSTHPERMRENFDIFDFQLSSEDMERISALGRSDGRTGPDPDVFDMVPG